MSWHYIIMGDVTASRDMDGGRLSAGLRSLVDGCNQDLAPRILSPLTITLGDEFQGVVTSLEAGLAVIRWFELRRLGQASPIVLRFVVHNGEISVPLNRKKAHGMLGPGLTRARELLSRKDRGRPRFWFELNNGYLARQLNRIFAVLEGLDERWSLRDYRLITDMILDDNNAGVAQTHGKDRSQIWKRRKHLQIEEYNTLWAVAQDLVANEDPR